MKILVVDDEPLARTRLRRLVEEIGAPYEVAGEAANGVEALRLCQQDLVDLVLLDIRMPVMGGLEAARHLARLPEPPAVVFVTAYNEHALEAFTASASDYLLKPVRRERLAEALQRTQVMTRAQRAALPENHTEEKFSERLSASYRGGLRTVGLEQILYLRAEDKYVIARTRNESLLLEDSLKQLEERFPDRFLRIHRNALVARSSLTGIAKTSAGIPLAVLSGLEERLPISRRHIAEVRAWLRSGAKG